MAIINFTKNRDDVPENAQCVKWDESNKVWTWHEYIGLCIKEREANYHQDSDFYMMIWDVETQKPREICFASTRGWSYPALGSFVDATKETMKSYNDYLEQKEMEWKQNARDKKAREIWEMRRLARDAAQEHNISFRKLLRLFMEDDRIKNLFAKKIRSKFKISLRNQCIAWLQTEKNLFNRPLSRKQLSCLE